MSKIHHLTLLVLSLVIAAQASAASRIVGHVKDSEGKGVLDVSIRLRPKEPGQPLQETRTKKKNGEFFFAMVHEGTYRLEASSSGWRVGRVSILGLDAGKKKSFDFASDIEPGAEMPEFSVGENDTVNYDIVVTGSSSGGREPDAGAVVLGTSELAALVQAGQVEKARAEILRALEASPQDAKLHYLSAFLETQADRLDAARQAADKAVAIDPLFPAVHLLRGTILRKQGDAEGALAEFRLEAAQTADPQVKRDAYVQIAETCRQLERGQEVQEALAKIIEIDPESSAAFTQLLEFHIRGGHLEEAEKLFASSPAEVRSDPMVHFNLGAAYWNGGHIDRAAEAFRKAIELDPNLADAHRQLGYALLNLGRKPEAAKELGRYLELSPNAPDASEVRELLRRVGT